MVVAVVVDAVAISGSHDKDCCCGGGRVDSRGYCNDMW